MIMIDTLGTATQMVFGAGAPVGADVLRWVWTDHRNPQLALAAAVVTGLCGPRESIDVCCLTW